MKGDEEKLQESDEVAGARVYADRNLLDSIYIVKCDQLTSQPTLEISR